MGVIGKGAFGKVKTRLNNKVKRVRRKGKHKEYYALKYINKIKCIEKNAALNIFRERVILHSLKDPFIVNLFYAFQDDDNLFMVLQLADGGDLRYHLDRLNVLKDQDVVVYAAEIASALSYMHSKSIIHR